MTTMQMLKNTMEYLVEDPDVSSSEEFFSTINDFLLSFEVSFISVGIFSEIS